MDYSDLPELAKILQDPEVMYAYEGAFGNAETEKWLKYQRLSYGVYGYGLWAVILKPDADTPRAAPEASGRMIGQCGITRQKVGDQEVLEIGYGFQKSFWGRGYATEAALACRDYGFSKLGADALYAIIRDNNLASMNVAIRLGMRVCDRIIKHYRGVDMPHLVFSVRRDSQDSK